MSASSSNAGDPSSWWPKPLAWWSRLAQRHPFVAFFLIIIWPNALWSVANLVYNDKLIVAGFCSIPQQHAFRDVAVPIYTALTWTAGMGICAWLIRPVRAYWRALDGQAAMTGRLKELAQKRLINLPWYQLLCNFSLWIPGSVYFPVMIYIVGGSGEPGGLGGAEKWPLIALQFLASFTVSAVVTTFQTFVLLERFLLVYFYPRIFTDVRPAEVPGAILVSFQVRLWLLWGAISLGPIIVLALIAGNLLKHDQDLLLLTIGVVLFGIFTGGLVFWVVGKDVAGCLETHVAATREIARENFDVRIAALRSDEWGRLTDSFNKMAQDLSAGRQVFETLGQLVGPQVRAEILRRYAGRGGSVEEITVMFADIRGFTRRAAGKAPEDVVELLNRFLSLAVQTIEGNGGWVNKFLGDGFMALFGAPLPQDDHADRALAAARDLLERLDGLNHDLEQQGHDRLRIGVGIHSGPALVGCIGATIPTAEGGQRLRLELTAIGETVNLTQRLEELTKSCGESLLFSEATRIRLRRPLRISCVGPQEIRGAERTIMVYTVEAHQAF